MKISFNPEKEELAHLEKKTEIEFICNEVHIFLTQGVLLLQLHFVCPLASGG